MGVLGLVLSAWDKGLSNLRERGYCYRDPISHCHSPLIIVSELGALGNTFRILWVTIQVTIQVFRMGTPLRSSMLYSCDSVA